MRHGKMADFRAENCKSAESDKENLQSKNRMLGSTFNDCNKHLSKAIEILKDKGIEIKC